MLNIVTLHPATAGADCQVSAALKDWVKQTWTDPAEADATVVTFSTIESWQDASQQFVNVDVYPSVYTVPTDLAWGSEYVIGSVQKVFTGTMLAGRILQGAANNPPYKLGSVAKQWLPLGNPPPDAKINLVSLVDLATHTACMVRSVAGENHGLYCPGGAPNQSQINAWRNNNNWLCNCRIGHDSNYSNWGSLTLGFVVAQPDNYNYDASLGQLILPYFGMTAAVTNTCPETVCVQGYGPHGRYTRPRHAARGIRSSIAEMTSFVGNYLYYSILGSFVPVPANLQFPVDMVSMALKQHLSNVPLGLDWYIRDFAVGQKNYTLFNKNGESGAQGFSSFVGFINTPDSWPEQSVIQAGVLVLVNMAMQGVSPSPTAFGRSLLPHLLVDGAIDGAAADDDEIDDADPEDRP